MSPLKRHKSERGVLGKSHKLGISLRNWNTQSSYVGWNWRKEVEDSAQKLASMFSGREEKREEWWVIIAKSLVYQFHIQGF